MLVAGMACGPRLPALPSTGGPPWIELTSAHFQFFTDAPEDQGRRVVKQMEDVRSVIYGAVFPDLPDAGQTVVIALRDWRESSMFTPPDHPAFAMPPGGSPIRQPTIVMPIDAYGNATTATHELAHALSDNAIHDQPGWFAEGLATYFETIKITNGDVELGRPEDWIVRVLGGSLFKLWPIASVFDCHATECKDTQFYIRAWALFAFLRNQHPRELVQLGRAIDDESRVTWNQVFPDLTLDHLDRTVGDWLLYGNLSVWHYKLKAQTWPVAVRTLADSEVLSLRALLWFMLDRKSAEVERNLDAAIVHDPNDLLANYLVAALHQRQPTVERASAIVHAHPKSWMAWWLLGAALRSGPQVEVVRTTLCALVARDPAIKRPSVCP